MATHTAIVEPDGTVRIEPVPDIEHIAHEPIVRNH